MEEPTEKEAVPAKAKSEHRDAARTTVESGASAAAGLHSTPPKEEVQASASPTAKKLNAGSSDR